MATDALSSKKYSPLFVGMFLRAGGVLDEDDIAAIKKSPLYLHFDGELSGVYLPPPGWIDRRYQSCNMSGGCNGWWTISTTEDFGHKGTPILQPAVYPYDYPPLQLSKDGRLNFYYMPLRNEDFYGGFCDANALYYYYDISDGLLDYFQNDIASYSQGLYWFYTYVQYYINKFLKDPYDITAKIPYGYNYLDQWRLKVNVPPKCTDFFGKLNFLIKPVGKKSFWDDVLNVAPLIVSGIVTAATWGIGTPALAVALGSLATKVAQADINKQAAHADAVNTQAQGLNAPQNINVSAENKQVVASGLYAFFERYKLWLLGGAAAIAGYFIFKADEKKKK